MVLVAPVAALESRIAWRSEPGPLSPVLLTTKVDRRVRSSITSKRGRWRNRISSNSDGDRRPRRRRRGESVCDWEWLNMALRTSWSVGSKIIPEFISLKGCFEKSSRIGSDRRVRGVQLSCGSGKTTRTGTARWSSTPFDAPNVGPRPARHRPHGTTGRRFALAGDGGACLAENGREIRARLARVVAVELAALGVPQAGGLDREIEGGFRASFLRVSSVTVNAEES